jgi:hypothetical protein
MNSLLGRYNVGWFKVWWSTVEFRGYVVFD